MAVTRFGFEGYGVRRAGSFAGKTAAPVATESLVCASISIGPVVTSNDPEITPTVTGAPGLEDCG